MTDNDGLQATDTCVVNISWVNLSPTADVVRDRVKFLASVYPSDSPIVDETELHILETKLTCRVWRGLSFTLGFLWEKFDYNDFNTEGFTNTPPGALLLGTLPADYDANFLYLKSTYKF